MFKTAASHSIGLSEIGHIREENQDEWGVFPDLGLYLLADGMGGRCSGGLAAKVALAEASAVFKELVTDLPSSVLAAKELMEEVFNRVNRKVKERGEESEETRGMGTTLVALWVMPTYALLGHVGDSRIYLVRDEAIERLTQDHAVVKKTPNGSRLLLSQAIGIHDTVKPTINRLDHRSEDLLMLCSDGLTGALPDEEMRTLLALPQPLEEKASHLMQMALAKGGRDNITFVLVQL